MKIKLRLKGRGNLVGCFNVVHLLAYLTNPYLCLDLPYDEELQLELEVALDLIFARFTSDPAVVAELKDAFERFSNRTHNFSLPIINAKKRVQAAVERRFPSELDPEIPASEQQPKNLVHLFLIKPQAAGDPVAWWNLHGRNSGSELFGEIMLRVHSSCPHAVSMERVNKSHKLIANIVRSRLANTTVIMLIYCYVNMRLLHKDVTPFIPMIESAITDDDGELPEADDQTQVEDEVEDGEALLEDARATMCQSWTGIPDLNLEPPEE
ncbi:hypothetical protein CYMTET_15413 [Cymbomonas tetramitiformis]|uniref:Uncharacterized protein n=1 Tax=Cymbomonas tetramitiformis TaxID=36881 RepID=A0AAE0L910_9CHLO|nr:hypothetical protein CYMTET_15413 [Cymbomonas tetramitiformis]|eukprot:gene18615-22226_t